MTAWPLPPSDLTFLGLPLLPPPATTIPSTTWTIFVLQASGERQFRETYSSFYRCNICWIDSIVSPPPPPPHRVDLGFLCHKFSNFTTLEWWNGGAAEADLGFVCFAVLNPCVLSANRVDLGFFLYHNKFSILPPPPPQRAGIPLPANAVPILPLEDQNGDLLPLNAFITDFFRTSTKEVGGGGGPHLSLLALLSCIGNYSDW